MAFTFFSDFRCKTHHRKANAAEVAEEMEGI
jgi:hypothetical protein